MQILKAGLKEKLFFIYFPGVRNKTITKVNTTVKIRFRQIYFTIKMF